MALLQEHMDIFMFCFVDLKLPMMFKIYSLAVPVHDLYMYCFFARIHFAVYDNRKILYGKAVLVLSVSDKVTVSS